MARNPDVAPRKRPTQERARATVDRIIDAAGEVLVERGYDGASTNRIAEAAGVSPGSLYQYFPNKDAVMAAVAERYGDVVSARVAQGLMAKIDAEPDVLVPTMIRELVEGLGESPELLRVITERAATPGSQAKLTALEERISDVTRAYLTMRRGSMREADIEAAAWILVRGAEHLCTRYVLDQPPISLDVFVEETSALVLRYLAP